MLHLVPQKLNETEEKLLEELQNKVNKKSAFFDRVQAAQELWKSKANTKKQEAGFRVITDTLHKMCVSTGVCNYCEQNEAGDIEHIFPKSFFPEFTFKWENYILACKQCNTGHKLDKAFVLDNNDELVALERQKAPPFNRIAFINIRTENPDRFMILNPLSLKFEVLPGLNKQDVNKAASTLNILELNERDTLIEARKSAARHYYDTLERLISLLSARKTEALKNRLSPNDDRFDLTKPLDEIKNEIKIAYKTYISNCQHPSVWKTIKIVQSRTDEKWKQLFNKLPEALNW